VGELHIIGNNSAATTVNAMYNDETTLHSSYTMQTAHNILRSLQIKLPGKIILKIVEHPRHIYHLLCQLTTARMYNDIVLDHCRGLDSYTREKIIGYLDSESAQTMDQEEAENRPASTVLAELHDFFHHAHDKLADLTDLLAQADDHNQQQRAKIQKICGDQLANWQALQKQHAEQIKQAADQAQLPLPSCFLKKLTELLTVQGITVELPGNLTSRLSQLTDDNFIQQSVIAALTCEAQTDQAEAIEAQDPVFIEQLLTVIQDDVATAWQQSMQVIDQLREKNANYLQIMRDDYQQFLSADMDLLELANRVRDAQRKHKERLRRSGANIDLTEEQESSELFPLSERKQQLT
jgi:hypothetical protein